VLAPFGRHYETCATLGITQAFTSYNNPQWNADREWLIRTFKEELRCLRKWTRPLEPECALVTWGRLVE